MNYRPLSVRTGAREQDGPYEGVPPHLKAQLMDWIREALSAHERYSETQVIEIVAVRLRVALPPTACTRRPS